ncbi:MAG TPA: hypothetical protein VMM78_10075 [Thermomicrobiales bacterium]|nr:hypothetical protein [Thermomicrobiales bacterium]
MGRIVAFPFVVVWAIIRLVLNLTGRLIAILIGAAFIIVGIALCATVIGAILGIPLILVGATLIIRAIVG